MKIYKPYEKRPLHVTKLTNKVVTEQSHKDECDINKIMHKFQRTGIITHSKKYEGQYDYATSTDFLTAMSIVARGQQMFDDLPSSLRSRFGNDPSNFLDFINDPANEDEAVKLGLLTDKNVGLGDRSAVGKRDQSGQGSSSKKDEKINKDDVKREFKKDDRNA